MYNIEDIISYDMLIEAERSPLPYLMNYEGEVIISDKHWFELLVEHPSISVMWAHYLSSRHLNYMLNPFNVQSKLLEEGFRFLGIFWEIKESGDE